MNADEIVTGERLQALAEATVIPPEIRAYHRGVDRLVAELVAVDESHEATDDVVARLASRRSIFVYTHALPAFAERIWPRLEGEGYVLITHNSDHEVGAAWLPWIEAAGAKLGRWFAQNVTIVHPKVEPLPIGIANAMWPHGDVRALQRRIRHPPRLRRPRLVMTQFSPGTHASRPAVADTLRKAFGQPRPRRSAHHAYPAYLADLARHRFCVCPRGNGVDTHRLWECHYLGVVPIVERSTHSEHWARVGLPAVVVDDWSEVTPQRLEAEAARLPALPTTSLALRLSHYQALIGEAVRLARGPGSSVPG